MSHFVKKIGILLLVSLSLMTACKKKKPTVPQPQSQAPTIQPEPQPPQPQPEPLPQPQPPAATATVPQQQKPSVTATKPKPKKHHVAKKPTAPAPAPAPDKSKTTVKEGGESGAPAGQLSAGIPQNEATRQRQTAAQLRQTTENNLRNINRQLSGDEQAMLQQIRTYLAQSRTADNDGDTERAYNLAFKAHLLSNELTKR